MTDPQPSAAKESLAQHANVESAKQASVGLPASPMDRVTHRESHQPYQHLIQSPYRPPVLPPLWVGLDRPTPSTAELPSKQSAVGERGRPREQPVPPQFRRSRSHEPESPSQTTSGIEQYPGQVPPAAVGPQYVFQPQYNSVQHPGAQRSQSYSAGPLRRGGNREAQKPSRGFSKRVKSAFKDLFKKDESEDDNQDNRVKVQHWMDEDY